LHGKELVLTAVNPNVSSPLEAEIAVRGARVSSASATVLTATDIHAHNTFVDHQAVAPKSQPIEVRGEGVFFRFPAASVSKLTLQLT
jgi:alpha-N-arabinofuranosidase